VHLEVSESCGFVELTINKKVMHEITIGFRTVADTAHAPKDFTHVDQHLHFGPRDFEKKIRVYIVDDEEWNPDLHFYVELYDPAKTPHMPQYHGQPINGIPTYI